MKDRKRRNELDILKLIGIKTHDLSTDTVDQWEDRRRKMLWSWVRKLASVFFFKVLLSYYYFLFLFNFQLSKYVMQR